MDSAFPCKSPCRYRSRPSFPPSKAANSPRASNQRPIASAIVYHSLPAGCRGPGCDASLLPGICLPVIQETRTTSVPAHVSHIATSRDLSDTRKNSQPTTGGCGLADSRDKRRNRLGTIHAAVRAGKATHYCRLRLLVSQRNHRIHSSCAPRREIAGRKRSDRHHRHHTG